MDDEGIHANARLARIHQLEKNLTINRDYQNLLQRQLNKVEKALRRNQELSERAMKHRGSVHKKTSRMHQRTRLNTGEKITGLPYFLDSTGQVCHRCTVAVL